MTMLTTKAFGRTRMTVRRCLNFLGLAGCTRFSHVEPHIKDRLVAARRNRDDSLAATLSEIKAFLKKRMYRTCEADGCTQVIEASNHRCKPHRLALYPRLAACLALIAISGCAGPGSAAKVLKAIGPPKDGNVKFVFTGWNARIEYERDNSVASTNSGSVTITPETTLRIN